MIIIHVTYDVSFIAYSPFVFTSFFSFLTLSPLFSVLQLLYFDGVVEKKVPKGIYAQPRKSTTEGGSEGLRCDHPIFVPLVKG